MKLSIVIICLNEEKHLPRCLSAIQKADHAGLELELIIADGGSIDRSSEIGQSFGARILNCPKGIPRQRNCGARSATGDILAYIDADVEVLDGWFATVARHFSARKNMILGCAPRLATDASWVAKAYALHWGLRPNGESSAEGKERLLSTQSLVMGREVFNQIGGFRENLDVDEDTVFVRQAKEQRTPIEYDVALGYIHHGEPKNLGAFFQRIKWGSNYASWFAAIRHLDWGQILRLQYLYGAVIAGEIGLLFIGALARYFGHFSAITYIAFGALTVTIVLPALRTAYRHNAFKQFGNLCLMYLAYGLGSAAAILGFGKNKAKRWR